MKIEGIVSISNINKNKKNVKNWIIFDPEYCRVVTKNNHEQRNRKFAGKLLPYLEIFDGVCTHVVGTGVT
jgi:hypothetical protein